MRTLRRVIRVSGSKLITLPPEIELGDYIWIEVQKDKLVIKRAGCNDKEEHAYLEGCVK